MIFQEAQTDHAARVQPITARLDMQLRQICYFLALCEEQSFTRAARRCGISQPSLTNAIIALEQELGGALFERRRGMALTVPTVLGHAVHPYLQRIAENVNCIRDTAQALSRAWAANRDASPTTLRVRNERIGGSDCLTLPVE
jgi:DNA-binding transcriptional LysR family regulator